VALVKKLMDMPPSMDSRETTRQDGTGMAATLFDFLRHRVRSRQHPTAIKCHSRRAWQVEACITIDH